MYTGHSRDGWRSGARRGGEGGVGGGEGRLASMTEDIVDGRRTELLVIGGAYSLFQLPTPEERCDIIGRTCVEGGCSCRHTDEQLGARTGRRKFIPVKPILRQLLGIRCGFCPVITFAHAEIFFAKSLSLQFLTKQYSVIGYPPFVVR